MSDFNKMPEVNICLLIFSVLVMGFILIAAITDPTRKRPFMKSFICLLASGIVVQLGEAGIWFFVGRTDNVISLTICCILSYGVGSFIVVLFTYTILEFFREKENISLLPAHVIAVISCVFTVFIITQVGVFVKCFFKIFFRTCGFQNFPFLEKIGNPHFPLYLTAKLIFKPLSISFITSWET